MNFSSLTLEGQQLFNRFKASLPQRLELDTIKKVFAKKNVRGKVFLDIGMPNPIMSALLRDHGGTWVSVARSPELVEEASRILEQEVVCLLADGGIPFEQHAFDGVVVSLGIFGVMEDPVFFFKECNRVLKSGGELIFSTPHKKNLSLINVLRRRVHRLVGGVVGSSYNERSLFRFLKAGFDVISVDSYCGFFVELVRLYAYKLLMEGMPEDEVCAKLRWVYRIADQFDLFGMWARGHVIVMHARRHQWRERRIPVLTDGRSIREAVLTKAED